MAFNVQTAGDEAIYCKFPGATGKPTPTSGRSISLPDGFKELRYIKDSTDKVIWAHKWRLTAKAGTGGTVSCSPAGARVKNGQTITVTATPDGTYKFTGWSDGSTTNPRSFTMTNHASITANFGSNTYTIIFKNYNASTSSAGTTLKTDQLEAGATPTPPSPLPTTPDSPVAGKTYTFTGWSPAVSKVTGPQTYVAQYSSGESTVTVTFKDYDGSKLKTSTVNYGTAATDVPKPDDPSRTGYKFTGWGNPDPASAVNASGQVIANCVYTAQYEVTQYTITEFTKDILLPNDACSPTRTPIRDKYTNKDGVEIKLTLKFEYRGDKNGSTWHYYIYIGGVRTAEAGLIIKQEPFDGKVTVTRTYTVPYQTDKITVAVYNGSDSPEPVYCTYGKLEQL